MWYTICVFPELGGSQLGVDRMTGGDPSIFLTNRKDSSLSSRPFC